MAAYLGDLTMSMQDSNGNYYYANVNSDGTWTVNTGAQRKFITMPSDWNTTQIIWQRDMNYLGVFRSMNTGNNYGFTGDGRAIIQFVRRIAGIQSQLKLNIHLWNEATFDYDLFYSSSIDFTTYKDNLQTCVLEIGTLDSDLIRDLKAYADTPYNIPVWTQPAGRHGTEYTLNADGIVNHKGIKVLYNSTWVSSATETTPLTYALNDIFGFRNGEHDDAHAGTHNIINLSAYNPVQNNGATTFIGNTILEKLLLQGQEVQGAGAGEAGSEADFNGVNNSQPNTRNNCALKDLLDNGTGVDVWVNVTASITGEVDYFSGAGNVLTNPFIGFAIFEIDTLDMPPLDSLGHYAPTYIYKFPLNPDDNPTPGADINVTIPYNVKYSKAYVFCLIFDADAPGAALTSRISNLVFSTLQFSVYSNYDYGKSGVPVNGPALPPSPTAFFRLKSLFEKLLPNLATTTTDIYGFPIPVPTSYTSQSDYLSPGQAPVFDCVPWNLVLTSAYCIHDLQGQSYITISLKQLFDFCKYVLGAGASLEFDANGNPTIFRVEPFSYFFDAGTKILDLGFDVENVTVEAYCENLGSHLKVGYNKADTNSNFGVDSFNTELYFNTPLSMTPGEIDMEEGDVITDQYAIELARVQQLNQPVGTSFDPANPSSDNDIIALYTLQDPVGTVEVYYPDNNPTLPMDAYLLAQRDGVNLPTAQSNDNTAATQPYINGLYYPDTAYNLEISPKRNLLRTGALLRSLIDNLDNSYLSFRKTGVMQFNNEVLALSGIESNLNIGTGAANVINEFADVRIGDLPAALFKPYLISFTSKYPINMYQLLQNNPRGYVQLSVMDVAGNTKVYKGFVYKAVQQPGTNQATEFQLLATSDMTF